MCVGEGEGNFGNDVSSSHNNRKGMPGCQGSLGYACILFFVEIPDQVKASISLWGKKSVIIVIRLSN